MFSPRRSNSSRNSGDVAALVTSASIVTTLSLSLGAGREGEPFEAIGRGILNIAHMPVYRDAIGGIGTPTSDNERTKIDLDTRRLLMCINIYGDGR